jgi:hypothetical protein
MQLRFSQLAVKSQTVVEMQHTQVYVFSRKGAVVCRSRTPIVFLSCSAYFTMIVHAASNYSFQTKQWSATQSNRTNTSLITWVIGSMCIPNLGLCTRYQLGRHLAKVLLLVWQSTIPHSDSASIIIITTIASYWTPPRHTMLLWTTRTWVKCWFAKIGTMKQLWRMRPALPSTVS